MLLSCQDLKLRFNVFCLFYFNFAHKYSLLQLTAVLVQYKKITKFENGFYVHCSDLYYLNVTMYFISVVKRLKIRPNRSYKVLFKLTVTKRDNSAIVVFNCLNVTVKD